MAFENYFMFRQNFVNFVGFKTFLEFSRKKRSQEFSRKNILKKEKDPPILNILKISEKPTVELERNFSLKPFSL